MTRTIRVTNAFVGAVLLAACGAGDGTARTDATAGAATVDEPSGADGQDGAHDEAEEEQDEPDQETDEPGAAEAEEAEDPARSLGLTGDELMVTEGPLDPGRYATSRFTVPAAFELDEGWWGAGDGPFWVGLYGAEVTVAGTDPDPPGASLVGVQVPTSVDDLVAQLEAIDSDVWEVLRTEPTELGGRTGTVLHAELSGDQLFAPLRTSTGDWFIRAADRVLEIHVLDAGERPVLVWVDGEREAFEEHRARAQPYLDSLRFG